MKIVLALIFALSPIAAQAETPVQRNEARAREIYQKLEAGTLPTFGADVEFFTGPCIITGSSNDPEGSYYAIFGAQTVGAATRFAWTISYNSSHTPVENPFLNGRDMTPKRDGVIVDFRKYRVPVSTVPMLFAEVSRPVGQANQLTVAGSHLGYFYCELERLVPSNQLEIK